MCWGHACIILKLLRNGEGVAGHGAAPGVSGLSQCFKCSITAENLFSSIQEQLDLLVLLGREHANHVEMVLTLQRPWLIRLKAGAQVSISNAITPNDHESIAAVAWMW